MSLVVSPPAKLTDDASDMTVTSLSPGRTPADPRPSEPVRWTDRGWFCPPYQGSVRSATTESTPEVRSGRSGRPWGCDYRGRGGHRRRHGQGVVRAWGCGHARRQKASGGGGALGGEGERREREGQVRRGRRS